MSKISVRIGYGKIRTRINGLGFAYLISRNGYGKIYIRHFGDLLASYKFDLKIFKEFSICTECAT